MADFFIHIGAHKTGTTSIQRFMSENSESALKMDTVFVQEPISPRGKKGKRVFYMNMARHADWFVRPSLNTIFRKLGNEREKLKRDRTSSIYKFSRRLRTHSDKNLVWSSEALFFLRTREEMKVMERFIDNVGSRPVFILFRRELESWRASWEKEIVKSIGLAGLSETQGSGISGAWYYDFEQAVEFWEKLGEVKVVEYASSENSIPKFLDAIGLNDLGGNVDIFENRRAQKKATPLDIINLSGIFNS